MSDHHQAGLAPVLGKSGKSRDRCNIYLLPRFSSRESRRHGHVAQDHVSLRQRLHQDLLKRRAHMYWWERTFQLLHEDTFRHALAAHSALTSSCIQTRNHNVDVTTPDGVNKFPRGSGEGNYLDHVAE